MAKKAAPRVGLDADVESLMQAIAVFHGGNLTAAVNYALRLAAPRILEDLEAYRPVSLALKNTTTPAQAVVQRPLPPPSQSPSPARSNAERLRGARL